MPRLFRSGNIEIPYLRVYAANVTLRSAGWFDLDDPVRGKTIVLQWHAHSAGMSPRRPNLAILTDGHDWILKRTFKDSASSTDFQREQVILGKANLDTHYSWVVDSIWSPNDNGFINIELNGKSVYSRVGPNVYDDVFMGDYTPYFKAGIYHASWKEMLGKEHDSSRSVYVEPSSISSPETIASNVMFILN
ncbi:heparin lyase I family protein [Vibrio sp. nBUS_14]|uniref:heparin lyase I family protein n=1 Tax=Vibrio sp. nBUS_14 TaxID=3395321 RepID=UPI003EBAFD5B